MALIDDINALPAAPADGTTGHLNNHKTLHAAVKDHSSQLNTLAGRVPSNAAVAKNSTYGTTYSIGGQIVSGETPLEDITARLTPPPNSGRLSVRRTATSVIYDFAHVVYNAGVVANLTLPAGWHPGRNQRAQILDANGNVLGVWVSTWQGNIVIRWDAVGTADHSIHFPVHAGMSWPPGAPD